MAKLIIPIGIPGCGKSTYARSLRNTVILSSDAIREDLFGDAFLQYSDKTVKSFLLNNIENVDSNILDKMVEQMPERSKTNICNDIVFETMYVRCWEALSKGKDVYLDATNLTKSERSMAIDQFKGLYDELEAVYFAIPFNECMSRNERRDRQVPYRVMKRMEDRLALPEEDEGWTSITKVCKNKIYYNYTNRAEKAEEIANDVNKHINNNSKEYD